MAQEAVVGFLQTDIFLRRTKQSLEKRAAKELLSEAKKNDFTCRNAKIEQTQLQLYGTSYFLVRNTPIGP